MTSNRFIILLLIAMSLLTAISIDIYLPSLPAISNNFSAAYSKVQLSMSLFLFGFAITQLVCGPLSDRFGRKRILLFGLIIYLIATLLCSLSTSINMLIFARFLQAVGACVGPVTAFAIVRDIFEQHQSVKILAYISTAMSVSPVLAPIVGGYLQHWLGWRSCFAFLAIFDVLLISTVYLKLPETNRGYDKRPFRPLTLLRNYRFILSNTQYQLFAFCLICGFSALFSFIINSPEILINQIKISPQDFGYLFSVNALALIIGGLITARLTTRIEFERIITIGASICLIAGLIMLSLALTLAISAASIIVPMLLYSIGIAMIVPTTIAGAMKPFPEKAGAASAMINCLRYLGASIIAPLVGYFHGKSELSLGIVITICSVLMLFSAWKERAFSTQAAPDSLW